MITKTISGLVDHCIDIQVSINDIKMAHKAIDETIFISDNTRENILCYTSEIDMCIIELLKIYENLVKIQ